LPDTGNDLQPLPQLLVRDQLFLQAEQHLSQLPFQLPDAPKKQAELKAVMGREEAPDGAAQFLGLLSARPGSTSLQVRQVRYPILVGQPLQDQSTRGPEDVCKDCSQFDVSRFQQLMHLALKVANGLLVMLTQAAQLAPLAHLLRRKEAALEQTQAQQSCQPLTVSHVGLPPRHVLDMAGVDQDHCDLPLQNVMHGTPVNSSAFHGHHRAVIHRQPLSKTQQLIGEGGKFLYTLIDFAPINML